MTLAQARVGRALVEGLRNPTVVRSSAARETFEIRPMSMREAFVRAIEEDAPTRRKIDTRVVVVDAPPERAFAPIRRIGGATGWYFGDPLWRLRGWLDGCVGGSGMPRHRCDPETCAVGDVIDGWRVEACEPDRLLRLAAGLKLPGRGWLEFRVTPLGDGARSVVTQTATFDPRGVGGRLYWYGVLPFHALIFRGLLRRIGQLALQDHPPASPSTFRYCSVIGAPAADVFRWHEEPGALAALTPPVLVRIEEQVGGIRDGGRVTLSIGVGRARVRCVMRHYGYVAGRQFCDEQVKGPFALWRHAHVFEPFGPAHTLHEDRIEFAVFRRGSFNRVAAAVLRPVLTLAFAHRHRIVRARFAGALRSVTSQWSTAAIALAVLVATMLPAITRAQTPAPTPPAVHTVPFVDLKRYAGDWFEIARYPNRFQRQCVGDVRASYARRPDGRIDVVNRCRTADGQIEARGVARIVDERTFTRLKVRFAPAWLSFVPAVWGDYWVIGLAADYSWAVVGEPGRDYLWILARTPQLDDASVAAARAAARASGYDVERLVETAHTGAVRP